MNKVAECCCGLCSIEVSGDPEMFGICHCNNGKKGTGSAFGISSYFSNSQIRNKTGEVNCYSLHDFEQKHAQKRYFCRNCGTTLFWSISAMPQLTGVAGGCFIRRALESRNNLPIIRKFVHG